MIVLASSSPRRKELLDSLGLNFEVLSPDVDETRHPDEAPTTYVERIARAKVRAVARPSDVVIAADTAVFHDGAVLGKPAHPNEARSMLHRLIGEEHHVITGVAVGRDDEIVSDVETTLVHMLPLTDEEITRYIATGEPMDKAGAYGLQGRAGAFIDRIEGSPSNVIGLPVHTLRRLLQGMGVETI